MKLAQPAACWYGWEQPGLRAALCFAAAPQHVFSHSRARRTPVSSRLQDVSLFCSLECKLDGLACSSAACGAAPAPPACHPPAAAGHIPAHGHAHAAPHAHHLPSSSHSSDSHTGPETPSHFRALRAVDGSSSDSDSVG